MQFFASDSIFDLWSFINSFLIQFIHSIKHWTHNTDGAKFYQVTKLCQKQMTE